MEKLITSEHLSDIKFAADCAIKEPDSIYSQEFFMLLDETFGSKCDYESPTQAVAVAWLINRVNELEQRAEEAEAEVEDTDKTMRAYSDQLVKVTAELVAAQAQLAELAKQKPIASTTQCQIDLSAEQFIGTMFGPSDMPIKLFTRPSPAAAPVDLVPDEMHPDHPKMRWVGIDELFPRIEGWNACRDEMLRRIEGLKK